MEADALALQTRLEAVLATLATTQDAVVVFLETQEALNLVGISRLSLSNSPGHT